MFLLLGVWFLVIFSFVAGSTFGRHTSDRNVTDLLNSTHESWWPQLLRQRYGICKKDLLG
jgi:hypothetical protein